jgi:hypothetical protein
MKVLSKYIVGYTYVNKQGLIVKVVEYRGRKDITVEFEIDGARKATTGSYIKKSLPLHPTFGKPFIGQQFPCHDGDIVEIIEILGNSLFTVKWLSDGTQLNKDLKSLKEGFNRHPLKNKPKAGQEFVTNGGRKVKVLEYKSATDIDAEFEDGTKVKTTTNDLNKGSIRYPIKKSLVGRSFTTNSGWICVVTDYKDAHNVNVTWQDGSESIERTTALKLGSIKPLNQPSVEGIGFIGVGRFLPKSYKDGGGYSDKIYGYWVRMFSRCYNPFELNKSRNAMYRDVHICKEWHNFQNFAEWAVLQVNSENLDYELEKDLLGGDDKYYCQENCCFLPKEINKFLMQIERGEHGVGAHYIRPQKPNAKDGWVARCHTGVDREYLGYFNTPQEASLAYKTRKEAYGRELAEQWKGKIDDKAYQALLNFTVKI